MRCNNEDWAVFWCSLLSPVLLGEIPERRRERYFQQLSQEERLLPNGRRKRLSARTLRRQWRRLKDEGVPGLYRRRRSDRGQPRKKHSDLLDRAVALKKEQPFRSDKAINRILKREFGRQLPRSTLYRHLRQQGATRRKLGVSKEIVRCRWTRDQPGALWVGDFEHGPPVMHQGRSVKTHLSAWIDCHSRYIVEARYYVRENLDILLDSLLRAWGNHGASRELYVDNAKIYHAKALQLACTQLNIQLLHRPPRDPPAGGLIERFFQTCQMQLEAEVRAGQILTLDDLNRVLAAWLAVAYHQDVNSETGQTPHARYHQEPRLLRQVDLGAVLGFFHREVLRTRRQGLLGRASWRTCSSPSIRRCGAMRWSSSTIPSRRLPKSSFTRPRALTWAAAAVTSGKREVIPNPRLRRLPDPLRPTISMPCGPNTPPCRSSDAAWASTTIRHGRGTCGPCRVSPVFSPAYWVVRVAYPG